MDRVLNRRYVLGAALCLCAGAVLGAVLVHHLVWLIIVPIVLTAVGILLLFLKRKFLFFALLSVAIGISVLAADYAVGMSFRRDGFFTFEGRVVAVEKGYVLFDEVELDGERTGGRFYAARSDFPELNEGEVVRCFVKSEGNEVDFFDPQLRARFMMRVYNVVTPHGEIAVVGKKRTVVEKIRDRIAESLYRYCSVGDAGVAESLLFGDKSDLAAEDREMMESIGMSHVFAVSGLHVGF